MSSGTFSYKAPGVEMKVDYLRLCSRASDNPAFIWFCDFPSLAGRLLCDYLGEPPHHVLVKANAPCLLDTHLSRPVVHTRMHTHSFAKQKRTLQSTSKLIAMSIWHPYCPKYTLLRSHKSFLQHLAKQLQGVFFTPMVQN